MFLTWMGDRGGGGKKTVQLIFFKQNYNVHIPLFFTNIIKSDAYFFFKLKLVNDASIVVGIFINLT